MFGIVLLEMNPSVCCRRQKSTTSVLKISYRRRKCIETIQSQTVSAGCLAARSYANHRWWSRSLFKIDLTQRCQPITVRLQDERPECVVRPIDEGSVWFTNLKERNDTINANKLNAREVAWTACMMLFSRATDPRRRAGVATLRRHSRWRPTLSLTVALAPPKFVALSVGSYIYLFIRENNLTEFVSFILTQCGINVKRRWYCCWIYFSSIIFSYQIWELF